MMLWRMDENAEQLQYYLVEVPKVSGTQHFVSVCYTNNLSHPFNSYLTLIGTSDGSILAFDTKTNSFVEGG